MSCTMSDCVSMLEINAFVDNILELTESFSVSLDAAILDAYPLMMLPPELTIEIEDFEGKIEHSMMSCGPYDMKKHCSI